MINHFLWFIRNQYCCMCGKMDCWDGLIDKPVCTVSHVKTRGSGGLDWNNVVPMCWSCHSQFEGWDGKDKKRFTSLALEYSDAYLDYMKGKWCEVEKAAFLREANGQNRKLYKPTQ